MGHPSTETYIAVRSSQEGNDLGQFRLCVVDPGDVVERDGDLLWIDPSCLRSPEASECSPARTCRIRGEPAGGRPQREESSVRTRSTVLPTVACSSQSTAR